MSMKMTKDEREAFLADLHVGVLGINHGDVPLAVPIWYDYEPGGDVWVLTSPDSIKGKALEDVVDERVQDGHAALADAGVGVHLLEDLVDVGAVAVIVIVICNHHQYQW